MSQRCMLGKSHARRGRHLEFGNLPKKGIRRGPSSRKNGDSPIAPPRQQPRVGPQPLVRQVVAVDFFQKADSLTGPLWVTRKSRRGCALWPGARTRQGGGNKDGCPCCGGFAAHQANQPCPPRPTSKKEPSTRPKTQWDSQTGYVSGPRWRLRLLMLQSRFADFLEGTSVQDSSLGLVTSSGS
jgi:hypothetical protein